MDAEHPPEDVTASVVDLIPAMRAYARSLCRNATDADDLVHEALVKALSNIGRYEPGTHLRAWLFTIMRNTFYTRARKAARERIGGKDCVSAEPISQPTQEWSLRGKELMAAMNRLPTHYRETLILVVVLGESYERTAEICGCRVGTVKSRISRARSALMAELGESVN